MPLRGGRQCNHPGCPKTQAASYCDEHKKEEVMRSDQYRESSCKRGYDGYWRKARIGWLLKHPLCVECERQGHVVQATVVDHRVPHRGDKVLFWDRNNWDSLCKPCHDAKTGRGL